MEHVLDTSPLAEVAPGTGGRNFVIGIDVGGTFTDAVCSDGTSTWRAKSPTNPARFSDGVLGDMQLLAAQIGITPEQLLASTERFGLGTTAVTNVFAVRRGRTVGLLTTRGFENHLHAMRNHRILVDGWVTMPWNPVAPDAVRGIPERINKNGDVVVALDEEAVRGAARELVERHGVTAFAISFLWSFRNPAHEARAAEIVREAYPDYPVFSGVDLHPLMREYERTTMAVLNAFASDALDGVEELEHELHKLGLKAPVLLLHSGGGAITVREAKATPLALASSGPAAGAVAAGEVAMAAGLPYALCCDMGGTSIDVAVVEAGVPARSQTVDIGGMTTGQSAIDVESIGAGGGSIAWIDTRGLIRVGPQSARATPGPVCYGRGGTEPTVTDAMILLGYMDPAAFMGGQMKLDVEAARAACARLGEPLGMDAITVAFGIREIALAEMSKAMRARISSGGLDVRQYGVVAFGGSGSLFAPAMARELELAWTLTPAVASVLSAYGAATADIRRDRVMAIGELLQDSAERAAALLTEMKNRIDQDVAAHGVAPDKREVVCEVELRFVRQRDSVMLTVQDGEVDAAALRERFLATYATQYGESGLTGKTPIELSTVRVTGIGRTTRATLPQDAETGENVSAPTPTGERQVFLSPDGATAIKVYDIGALTLGQRVAGPALLDNSDTTLWAPPGSTVEVVHGSSLLTKFEA